MKVFVTGGSGFVGSHVIARLVASGYDVSALSRSANSAAILASMGASPVLGHLENIEEWQSKLQGCHVVVHCAAPLEFWGKWEKFEREIVSASVKLLDASAKNGVKRFVYISSESALQDVDPLVNIDEAFPYPMTPNSFYGLAKKQAEIELMKFQSQVDIVILRPTFVWGAGATALTTIGSKAKSGAFMWVDHGKCSFEAVHVKNLAEAVVLAVESGRGKNIYFVTDHEFTTVREFFGSYFQATGIKMPTTSLPNSLVKFLALSVELIWKSLGITKAPPLSRFEWAFVGMPRSYNISKIMRELNYKPIISRKMGFNEIMSKPIQNQI